MDSWISAGHGPLLFYDAVAHRFEELAVYDIPLGVQGDWAFHETERSEWPEVVCAEGRFAFHHDQSADLPHADKPDF